MWLFSLIFQNISLIAGISNNGSRLGRGNTRSSVFSQASIKYFEGV
ncbi:hypothetical protein ACFP3I_11125 [Chryseobacterium arachidis]